ncbi:MAG: hypothetical protein ACK559_27415, partial [bacterium]
MTPAASRTPPAPAGHIATGRPGTGRGVPGSGPGDPRHRPCCRRSQSPYDRRRHDPSVLVVSFGNGFGSGVRG